MTTMRTISDRRILTDDPSGFSVRGVRPRGNRPGKAPFGVLFLCAAFIHRRCDATGSLFAKKSSGEPATAGTRTHQLQYRSL
jgi:hypothetical protein